MTTATIEARRVAILACETAKSEAGAMAQQFEKEKIDHCNHVVAIRFEPKDGSWYSTCEVSWGVSEDEYFSNSGLLSQMTLLSGKTSGTPGPDDGYEWEDDAHGPYVRDESARWSTYDDVISKFGVGDSDEVADELISRKQLTRFSVSSTPVDPDYSAVEKQIEESLDERILLIQKELDEVCDG